MTDTQNPFAHIKTAERGTFRSSVSGRPTPEDTRRDLVGFARSAAIRKFGELLSASKNPNKAILELLTTPEGAEALFVVPDLLTDVDKLVKLAAEEKGKTMVVPGTSRVVSVDPEGKAKILIPAKEQRTKEERLTDAIIQAEKSKDSRRAELLLRQLPRDVSGDTSTMDSLKLRAAGVPGDKVGNSIVGAISVKQAQTALQASKTAENVVSINDLAICATGHGPTCKKIGGLTPAAAEAALKGRGEALGSENFLKAMFGQALKIGLPKGKSLFQEFRERTKGGKPRPTPPVPIAGEPGTTRPTPEVSGEGAIIDAEAIKGLSIEDLRQLAEQFEAQEVQLSPEAVAELIGRLKFGGRAPTPSISGQ